MQQEQALLHSEKTIKQSKTRPATGISAFGGNKVAPGMEISFIVRFSPEAKIDYFYELIVVTEREKFVVPIMAVGKRAVLDFPDLVDFENCPVKYCSEKPVIIRNLGDKTCKWQLKLEPPFDSDLKEGVLEQQRNEQILLKFNPTEAKQYKTEAILLYENLEAYVILQGKSHNGNVYLSKSHISMDDAYIGLQTQQTLQIINKSNVKVEFQWRAFKTEKEEQEKKNRLRQQLEQEEAEEKMLVKDIVSNEIIKEEYDIDLEEESDEEEKDEKVIMLKKQKKAELMLSRKYKTILKAIDDDMLLFQDDIFTIEPSFGQIWPNSEITITIAFFPKAALNYQCTAFCNVSCSDTRLPLHITGEGVGPKATVYPNYYNIGDIFIKDERKCDFMIENQGEIEARFELMPNDSLFSKMFHFGIERGVLGVGERIPFQVQFCSTILGNFNERFMWKLDGSSDLHHIDFTGHVISPSFKFDRDEIDFGKVSFSFPNKQKVKLTNTSTVPFKFFLRIPAGLFYFFCLLFYQENKQNQNKKEFDIKPNRDLIPPNETVVIEVTFISQYPKQYDTALVIDIEGVGLDMHSIPIKAESEVPTVRIEPPEFLVFEDVFLRNPSIQTIQIINESNLQARFNILPQIEETKILADYYVDQESGEIERNGRAQIQVTLITKKLKEISLKLEINIEGNTLANPYTLILQANSKGPQVRISEKDLNFGQIDVLRDYVKKVTVINEGKIEADFYAFTQSKNSIFKPLTKEAILKPQESKEVEVICNADDTIRFHDILYFVIKEGVDIEVSLQAIGVKTTIFCKENITDIQFGVQYTHRTITKEIFVENKGRRPQMLTWVQKKPTKKEIQQKEEEQKKQKKTPQQLQEEEHVTFWVIPEKKEIPPKFGYMFQFKAHGIKAGNLIEQFSLNSQMGNDRKSIPIYPNIEISAQFIAPQLTFSERKLYFKYSWEKNVPLMPLTKTLTITCSSLLPTNFMLKTLQPFQISAENFQLLPNKSTTLRVDFDPGLKTDRVSDKLPGKLQVHHLDHPEKDSVELIGEVCFPNLEIEKKMLNFGSILNETSKKQIIWIKNVSEMALNYQWTFQEEMPVESVNASKIEDLKHSQSQLQSQQPPINEIFDILPLSGNLQPGEVQNIEFIFNALGQQQRRYKTTALCKVEGGPDYEVTLIGDAALISYKISTYDINLGEEIRFCD